MFLPVFYLFHECFSILASSKYWVNAGYSYSSSFNLGNGQVAKVPTKHKVTAKSRKKKTQNQHLSIIRTSTPKKVEEKYRTR